MRAQAHWTSWAWAALIVASAAILLVPALYNGFPLLFPDTDTYLKVAYGQQWTLDRSGFYGFWLKPIVTPMSGTAGLWTAVFVQASLIAGILALVARRLVPSLTPLQCLGLIGAVALLTSLAWHAGQLMPDAFTGPLILLTWLVASRDIEAPGTPLLWLAAGALALLHYTHLGLFAVAAATTLLFNACTHVPLREIAKRALAAILVILAVASAHIAVYGVYFDRWSVSPMGSWFLFARLHEDGLAEDYMDRHCGRDAPAELCTIRARLPRDSQVLLWSETSPLYPYIQNQIGSKTYWHWSDMMGEVVSGSIREEPLRFLRNSVGATLRQFVHFQTLDDQCPEQCHTSTLIQLRPDAKLRIQSSRQLRNAMPKAAIRTLDTIVEILGLLLLVPAFVAARRMRDTDAQALLVTITVCLLANAAVSGALSAVNDRYESRVVWLAVFSVALVTIRRLSRAQSQTALDERPIVTTSLPNQVPDQG